MKITLTFDLTEENLDKLKAFCTDTKATTKVTTKKTAKKQAKEAPIAEAVEPVTEAIENDTGTWTPGGGEQDDSVPITSPETVTEIEKAKEKITKTDVRAVALKISKAGKSDVLREIFSKFGATNLKGIAEDDYEALMRELVAVDV